MRRFDVRPEILAHLPAGWSEGTLVYQGIPENMAESVPGEKVNTGTLSADGRTLVIAATDRLIFLDTQNGQPTVSTFLPIPLI